MIDDTQLVEQYKAYRNISRDFHTKLLKYLPKAALDCCGKRLGVMRGKTLLLNDEQDVDVFMDYCIYDYYENGLNAVSLFFEDNQLTSGSDEYKVIEAICQLLTETRRERNPMV